MTNELTKVATDSISSLTGDIYKDLLRPSVARVGFSLETIVKVALTPFSILDWGFEQSKEWLQDKIEERLRKTPPEFVVKPSLNIVSAALQRIATSHDTPELRELFAELLLKAMDSRTANDVHPAYFYIVEQLAPREALVLVGLHDLNKEVLFAETSNSYYIRASIEPSIEQQFRSFCESILHTEASYSNIWLKNLCRLGVLELNTYGEAIFKPEDGDSYGTYKARVDNLEHQSLIFTEFGKEFITACAPLNNGQPSIKPEG